VWASGREVDNGYQSLGLSKKIFQLRRSMHDLILLYW